MSEIKIFRVIGNYLKNHKKYLFRKEVRALKQEDALEKFAEEIADVELMLDEMKYYFKNVPLIAKYRKLKEKRLRKLVGE